MNRLCLSAALLFLLVILVDSTSVYEHHTQDEGRSSLTSPLQTGGKWWKSMEAGRAGVGWVLPTFSGFLLSCWAGFLFVWFCCLRLAGYAMTLSSYKGYSGCGVWASHRGCRAGAWGVWVQSLWFTCLVAMRHMESSQTRGQSLFPALAGRFLTTGPPGKAEVQALNSTDVMTLMRKYIKYIYIHIYIYIYIPPKSTRLGTPFVRLSILGPCIVPDPHYSRVIKRSICDPSHDLAKASLNLLKFADLRWETWGYKMSH